MNAEPRLFLELSDREQASVAGGNFAYDVGRVIRFAGIAFFDTVGGVPGTGVPLAVVDWEMHAA
jgi:hypothetical protein